MGKNILSAIPIIMSIVVIVASIGFFLSDTIPTNILAPTLATVLIVFVALLAWRFAGKKK